ncbi:hypothetical protein D3C77_782030 [compost metagenome]
MKLDRITQSIANTPGGGARCCVNVDLQGEAVDIRAPSKVVLWAASDDLPDRVGLNHAIRRFPEGIEPGIYPGS